MGTASRQTSHKSDEFLPKDLRRCFLITSIGFALVYAVCVSFFYSSVLVGNANFSVALFDNILNPSILVASLILSLLIGSKLPIKRLRYVVIGYIGLALGLLGTLFATLTSPSFEIVSASALFAGFGMGLVMPFYFELLAPYSPRAIALGCGIMALGGMALSMLADLLPTFAAFTSYLVFLTLSAISFFWAMRHASYPQETAFKTRASAKSVATRNRSSLSKRVFLDIFLVSSVCTFALSIVYGILDVAAMGSSPAPEISILISQFGGIAAAVVFLLFFGLRTNPSSSLLFNIVFGILATGILFLPFLSSEYTVSLNIVAAAGWKLVMLALFYLVLVTYATDRKRLLVGIALAYALPRFGLFVGLNVAHFTGIGSTVDFVRITAVAFFLLYLILMVVWIINSHDKRKAEMQAKAADQIIGRFAEDEESAQKLRCDAVAEEGKLTNRERDILYLLAQGRDISFICDTLFLSKNTVKSYQKAIYSKLDVHSKQEVIDLCRTTT